MIRCRGMAWRPRRWVLATAVILCSFAAWSGSTSHFGGALRPLSGLNAPLYDTAIGLAGLLQPREWQQTAVVLIDQKTLDAPGWASAPRALQQPQLGRLADTILSLGAKRVGFDLVFAFDPSTIRLPLSLFSAYDATFTRLLREHSDQLVLGIDASVSPATRYATLLPSTALGAIDLTTESDGIVRSVVTRSRLDGGRRVLGFAEALVGDGTTANVGGSHAFIVPRSTLDRIPHLSAATLEGCLASLQQTKALARLFQGRTVLIGAGLAGEDTHQGPDRFLLHPKLTPEDVDPCRGESGLIASRGAGQLPGVFLQAAAAESLLDLSPLTLADTPARVMANVVIALLAILAQSKVDRVARLPDRRGWMFGSTLRAGVALVISVVVFVIGAVGLETAALLLAKVWLPIGPTLAAGGLLGVAQTMVMAVRRDVSLAELRISFGRWLPLPVIEATLGSRPTPVLGQERVITVLIADLMNFTSFCAVHRREPEQVVAALNRKFSAAQLVIDKYGGCVDKFDGDAVIAFWNGIDDQPDHAHRAIAAAKGIVAVDQEDDLLQFKCAIATGIAFVGCYGSERKSSFSAIGEPMNLASRLESLCRPHGLRIVIAASTRDAFGLDAQTSLHPDDACLSDKIGEARLKGFPEPMAFFTVQGSEGDRWRPTGTQLFAHPLAVEHET